VTSAIYLVTAELADEYVGSAPEHAGSVLATARGFMLLLGAMTPSTLVLLTIAVLGFAAIAGRHHLVPRWLGFVALAAALAVPAWIVSRIVGDDTVSWILLSIGFLLMVLWLAIAGGWLLLGGSKPGPDARTSLASAAAPSGG